MLLAPNTKLSKVQQIIIICLNAHTPPFTSMLLQMLAALSISFSNTHLSLSLFQAHTLAISLVDGVGWFIIIWPIMCLACLAHPF